MRLLLLLLGPLLACFSLVGVSAHGMEPKPIACRIVVRDKQNGWPTPLIELRTTNNVRFVTDNAGVIAVDAPDLLNRETWFTVIGHGYSVPADGFGYRGVRLTPKPNETLIVEVERTCVAKRLGRLTGGGLFAESQKLGDFSDWTESPILGCDSVQMLPFQNKMFWNWGDTAIARYPLGNFHMTGATTSPAFFDRLEPPIKPRFDYFLTDDGRPRGMAPIPGEGPTWLTGYAVIPDAQGKEHLVATYNKVKGFLDIYEVGLCEYDVDKGQFVATAKLWTKSDGALGDLLAPRGHLARWQDDRGQQWLLFGDPFPVVKVADSYEAWRDRTSWTAIEPSASLQSADGPEEVQPHSGSIAWNEYRQRWITVFMQKFGKPSPLGELWYAESKSPLGPWGPAIKVVTHENYTFYNPRVHAELSPAGSPILLFEGTYTAQFADHPDPTPRYDYNQIVYRLDLDDPRLKPAQP